MKEKIERIQKILRNRNIDAWLIFSYEGSDIHSEYVLEKHTTAPTLTLIKQHGKPVVIAVGMEAIMLNNEIFSIKPYSNGEEMGKITKEELSQLNKGDTIAMNYMEQDDVMQNLSFDILGHGTLNFLKNINPDLNIISARDLIFEVRSVKTKREIENHKIAADLAEELMENVVEPKIKPGVTEKEIKALVEYECNKRGGISFEAIVASGENSAIPHHHSGDKKIKSEEVLLIDYGVSYNFSNSDITHTYWVGSNPPEKVLNAYEAVHEAKQAAYKMIKAGVLSSDVENAVRETMKEYGFDPEKYFIHSTGHPLGIQTHDIGVGIYRASKKRPSKPLIENSIVTVEPGLYFPGEFGIRLEDDIVVTKDGYIQLSSTPKEMKML